MAFSWPQVPSFFAPLQQKKEKNSKSCKTQQVLQNPASPTKTIHPIQICVKRFQQDRQNPASPAKPSKPSNQKQARQKKHPLETTKKCFLGVFFFFASQIAREKDLDCSRTLFVFGSQPNFFPHFFFAKKRAFCKQCCFGDVLWFVFTNDA